MLRLLPNLQWPITPRQIEPLLGNLVQLNLIEAHLSSSQQRALSILFSISDRWVKSNGKLDYRGSDGHARLMQDAMSFVGATPIVTRHGDLAASHLALDFHDAQCRLMQAGHMLLSDDRDTLLSMVQDFINVPPQTQDQILVLMDYLSKKPMPS